MLIPITVSVAFDNGWYNYGWHNYDGWHNHTARDFGRHRFSRRTGGERLTRVLFTLVI